MDARGVSDLEAAADEVRAVSSNGAQVLAIGGDVTSASHRSELAAAAGRLGGLDLLVNNASTSRGEPIARASRLSAQGAQRGPRGRPSLPGGPFR